MASDSLESLLAWMQEGSRLWGWDAIVALSAETVNSGLHHIYIRHLLDAGDQRVPAGSFAIPETDISVYLQDVVLGAPCVSFQQASLDASELRVTLPLLTGREVTVKAETAGNTIQRIALYDPLNAPPLQIELKPSADERRVELNLARSDEVKFMFASSLSQQLEGGRFFKRWFDDPQNRQQTYAMAVFPDQGNSFMLSRRIEVRTQSDKAPSDGRQAMILFVTLEHGITGAIPDDDDPAFKYLIPNDSAPGFTAAAMFSLHLQHRAAFGNTVLHMLGSPPFHYSGDASGLLETMVAQGGMLQVPAVDYESLDYAFESEVFSINATPVDEAANQALHVQFETGHAMLLWRFPATLSFRYAKRPGHEWQGCTATFDVRLQYEFRLAPDESGASAMEGHLFAPYADSGEVIPVSGLPDSLPAEALKEIVNFVGQIIKRALLERMAETLTTVETDVFVAGCDFGGGQRLRHSVTALPCDFALFGKVGASAAPLTIVEQQPLLPAGAQQQFTCLPAVEGLRWSVESLPGNTGDPGVIDEHSGMYRAPPAHAMGGLFNRVAIVATHPETQDIAITSATVFAHRIAIRPLLHLCNFGERVELTATVLGTDPLSWSIKNPVAGESGELVASSEPDGDHTYVAHDRVNGKSFVFDEIQITTGQPGQAVSAFMVVMHASQTLNVKPLQEPSLPAGQVQLRATVNQTSVAATWSLPFGGPGSIDADGLYTAPSSTKDLFVIVTASYEHDVIGRLEGYRVLPLPLADASELMQLLAR